MKENFFYIYNYNQADFFIKNGLCPVGVGKGNKDSIFVKFKRDTEAEAVFSKWKSLKYGEDVRPPKQL